MAQRTAAAVMALALFAQCVSAQNAFVAGTAGHYAGPNDVDPRHAVGQPIVGSCGFGELRRYTWPYFAGAAVGPESAVFKLDGQPANGCGRCLEMQCTDAKRCPGAAAIQAQVVDTCQSCASTEINVPYPVFVGNLTNNFTGQVPIRFRQVPCAPPEDIVLNVVEVRASRGGFIQLAVQQAAGSGELTSVKLRSTTLSGANTPFTSNLQNEFGAVWQSPAAVPAAPLDVQIVDGAGNTRVARAAIPTLEVGQYQTAIQFPLAPAATPAVAGG